MVAFMHTHEPPASRKLEALAMPLVASFVHAVPGDTVRMASAGDGTWFYCRVEETLDNGDLVCTIVEAQSWPSLIIDGILPGKRYAISPDRVLSIVPEFSARR